MNDAEWATCTAPLKMLLCLRQRNSRRRVSERKLRLFACACVRRLWQILTPADSSVRAVETAERFADGEASLLDLRAASEAAEGWSEDDADGAARAAACYTTLLPQDVPSDCYSHWTEPVTGHAKEAGIGADVQCALLREIFGKTCSKLPAVNPFVLAWSDGAVRKIAQLIYDDRAFDQLPLLADALEDSNCTDAAMLSHCREPGEHVRGCWVVDLLLGKT